MPFNLLGGGLDQNGIVTAMNQNILELKNREKTEIFKDDTGTPRVILDNNGLRTTPAGVDVTTAGNTEYSFNSAQNTLKVVATGTTTMTPSFSSHGVSSSGTDQATVHVDLTSLSLTNPPAILLYVKDNTYYRPVTDGTIYSTSLTFGASFTMYFKVGANTTDLSIGFWQSYGTSSTGSISAFSGTTFNFRYYILQETAN
jgi:hypothetical protein